MSGLQHVSLETRPADVDAEVAFWALLGFSRVESPGELGERTAWVQAGDGSQIHLLYASDPVTMPKGHVAVLAPAFDATVSALEDAGHAVEPRTQHWGAPRSYVRSPAGHLVEVMAAPPMRRA
ncbi:MAG TPA: VOC family protein [Baekduia sp.]|nr:VOC family protein [Baekduia sp.]